MSIDDQNVINQVFTPQVINCILILRKIELNNEKICIVRISESCQFSSHNYTNHQIFIYDVQILWINKNRSNKKIYIFCENNQNLHIQSFSKGIITNNEIELQIDKISNNLLDPNSSIDLITDTLIISKKILSLNQKYSGIRNRDKLFNQNILNCFCNILEKKEMFKTHHLLLTTMSNYIRRMIEYDHQIISSKVIPIYIKFLESKDDNICFYSVEGFNLITSHCNECLIKSLESGILSHLLPLLKPSKSLSLLRIISSTIALITKNQNYLLTMEEVNKLLEGVIILTDHTDHSIILDMMSVIRIFISFGHDCKQLIIESGICLKLLQMLNNNNNGIKYQALSVLSSAVDNYKGPKVFYGNHFNLQLYEHISTYLQNQILDIRVRTATILSQISFENEAHIQTLIDSKLFPILIDIIKNDLYIIKPYIVILFSTIIKVSNEEQLIYFYSNGIIYQLCNLLPSSDELETNDLIVSILIISIFYHFMVCHKLRAQIIKEICEYGGIEKINRIKIAIMKLPMVFLNNFFNLKTVVII
jgi:hypothetical protein